MKFRLIENKILKYYHGSYHKLPDGLVLVPDKGNFMGTFSEDEMESNFILEKYRPSHFLSRNKAVYMCDNIDDLDNAGAAIDYIYIVQPLGKIEKHDLGWMTEIDLIMSETKDLEKIKEAALNYWNGVPHDDLVWEYLTTSAKIIKEVT